MRHTKRVNNSTPADKLNDYQLRVSNTFSAIDQNLFHATFCEIFSPCLVGSIFGRKLSATIYFSLLRIHTLDCGGFCCCSQPSFSNYLLPTENFPFVCDLRSLGLDDGVWVISMCTSHSVFHTKWESFWVEVYVFFSFIHFSQLSNVRVETRSLDLDFSGNRRCTRKRMS